MIQLNYVYFDYIIYMHNRIIIHIHIYIYIHMYHSCLTNFVETPHICLGHHPQLSPVDLCWFTPGIVNGL